jgi:hypothetical protein
MENAGLDREVIGEENDEGRRMRAQLGEKSRKLTGMRRG